VSKGKVIPVHLTEHHTMKAYNSTHSWPRH